MVDTSVHDVAEPRYATSDVARPRVLFLNHAATIGGGELSLIDIVTDWSQTSRVVLFENGPLVQRLRQRGTEVRILQNGQDALRVTRESGLSRALRSIPDVLRLTATVSRMARSFDVIYAGSQKAMIVGALAGWFASKPVIWHLRDILTDEHFSSINRAVVALCSRAFLSKVICNSEATRQALIENGGPTTRADVVYNGIDPSPFVAASKQSQNMIRSRLGLPIDAPLVGIFSRIAAWKGQHILVEALRDLPSTHAVVVGDAMFAPDHEYKDDLLEHIERLDLTDRVHMLGFRDDVADIMQAVDVVAHTSTKPEPFGRVIIEGMLSRRPVVAARAGGPTELIDDGVNGLLTNPDDPEDLVRALKTAFANADELAMRGFEHAQRHFSVDVVRQRVRMHIHSVC